MHPDGKRGSLHEPRASDEGKGVGLARSVFYYEAFKTLLVLFFFFFTLSCHTNIHISRGLTVLVYYRFDHVMLVWGLLSVTHSEAVQQYCSWWFKHLRASIFLLARNVCRGLIATCAFQPHTQSASWSLWILIPNTGWVWLPGGDGVWWGL